MLNSFKTKFTESSLVQLKQLGKTNSSILEEIVSITLKDYSESLPTQYISLLKQCSHKSGEMHSTAVQFIQEKSQKEYLELREKRVKQLNKAKKKLILQAKVALKKHLQGDKDKK